MEWITWVYLVYIFISLYFFSLFLLIYLKNRKGLFEYPELKKHFSVSVVVPCWNEGKNIIRTVEAIMNMDYDNLKEVIVVNDGSTDNTLSILKELKKKYPKLVIVDNKKNTGSAAGAKNLGIRIAKGELIACIDADSFPNRDVLKKIVGYFEDKKVGVVTIPHLSLRRETFLDKIHTINDLQFVARL